MLEPPDPASRSAGGELITASIGSDGGRRITAWMPPDPVRSVLYAGDGQLLAPWGAALTAAGQSSTMIVGIHRATDETTRLHEYSPGFDPAVFAAHERLLLDDARGWVVARLGVSLAASRTGLLGVSAGAELALALGLRHPDSFGVVLAASPGAGYRPIDTWPAVLPRVHLVAGTQEPFFLENAVRWATALRKAGADVVLRRRPGGHDPAMWREELLPMVEWAFGAPS